MSFTENYLKTEDHIQLYYRKYDSGAGNKPTVICLAGLTQNSKIFHQYATHCAKKFQVNILCPDMRGRGKSEYDPTFMNYNPLREAQDVLEIIAHENIQNMILIGTSRGGMQSALITSMLPQRIKGVILNDIGAVIPITALIRLKGLFSMNTDFIGPYDTALKVFYARDNGMTKGLTPPQEQEIINAIFMQQGENYYLDYDYIGLGQAFDQSLTQMNTITTPLCDLKPLFQAFSQVPALLLQGEKSDILPNYALAETQEFLPNIQAHSFKDRGHTLYFNEPQVIEVCDAFLLAHLS